MSLDVVWWINSNKDDRIFFDFFDFHISQINEYFQYYNWALSEFLTLNLSEKLNKKLIEALNWRYEVWESVLYQKWDDWYIYWELFTFDELKEIVEIFFNEFRSWENKIDIETLLEAISRIHALDKEISWIKDKVNVVAQILDFSIHYFENTIFWIISDAFRLSEIRTLNPQIYKKLRRLRWWFRCDDRQLHQFPTDDLFSQTEKDEFGWIVINTFKNGKTIDVMHFTNDEISKILLFRNQNNTRLSNR